ncbi:Glucose-methanol-choline (GMC) oxidoreductase:NAD binding site [hydrothermal vent metagenome]|uniref:Glucose-methanol-choline (GMC) oxidoreductase:NAD binding site n=1 Tax=hydrothermal vent metagenome TaxID=652676 RepID=A0A3B0UES6_9ZZZZ
MATEPDSFGAIVIGSGISGGWAAKELCEKGLKTLVLERGRNVENLAGVIVVRTLGRSVAATATLSDIMDGYGIGCGDHPQLVPLVPLLSALGLVGFPPKALGLPERIL